MDILKKKLVPSNDLNCNLLAAKDRKLKKPLSVYCDFVGNPVIDFSSELKKLNPEEDLPLLDRFPNTEQRPETGVNRMFSVLKQIEAMYCYETDYLNGYDLDDDFIDEGDEFTKGSYYKDIFNTKYKGFYVHKGPLQVTSSQSEDSNSDSSEIIVKGNKRPSKTPAIKVAKKKENNTRGKIVDLEKAKKKKKDVTEIKSKVAEKDCKRKKKKVDKIESDKNNKKKKRKDSDKKDKHKKLKHSQKDKKRQSYRHKKKKNNSDKDDAGKDKKRRKESDKARSKHKSSKRKRNIESFEESSANGKKKFKKSEDTKKTTRDDTFSEK
jgi:hypothetical protein